MKIIALVLGVAFLTAGCVDGKFIKRTSSNNCDGTGWTHTIVYYGDSRAFVIPLSDAAAGEEFRFYLVPQRKGRGAADYVNAQVRISAKSSSWFTTVQGDRAGNVFLTTCVDDTLATGTTHEYLVEVFEPGGPDVKAWLDPRAIIIDP